MKLRPIDPKDAIDVTGLLDRPLRAFVDDPALFHLLPRRRKKRIVLFAGGGGSCLGIKAALGVDPDAALNHWDVAVGVHKTNFPNAEHFCADVMETCPTAVCPGEPIELLWLSPDCRHFSAAKGSAPVSPSIRSLGWAAIPWAKIRRPDVIMVENVAAFLKWGPVIFDPTLNKGQGGYRPDPAREGETFRRWVRRLEQCGYVVEWRISSAAAFGANTDRKRLLIIARCDGKPIEWPAEVYAHRKVAVSRGLERYPPAHEIIDFSRPCPSIFMTQAEAAKLGLRVKRPLEENTLARIAKGLFRHAIEEADPFIVPVTNSGWSADRSMSVHDALPTIMTEKGGAFALVAPVLVGTAHGEHERGAGLRAWSAEDSLRVATGTNDKAVAAAFLEVAHSRSSGCDLRDGLPTAPAHLHHGVVAAFMEQANTGMVGHDLRAALSTTTGTGTQQRLIAAQLTHLRASNTAGGKADLREPLNATTAQGGHQALLETLLARDVAMSTPFSREGEVRAFLMKYFGHPTEHDLRDPLGTATSKARFGIVMVRGVAYRIVDIGMRMLDPEAELAAAMGVPKSHVLNRTFDGRPVPKTKITKMVGNMVSPPWAAAHIAANLPPVANDDFAQVAA